MNAHLAKFLMYYEIHRHNREDHSVRKITALLGLNRRTIRKYLSMSEMEYECHLLKGSNRKKELQPYEIFVKE
jgi:predicted AAA+ superfamily ATPase